MALIDQIGLDKPPTESVDIAGNLSKGLQTGMQLATAKEQVESQKLKLEEDRYRADQMKFAAFDSMMKNLNRMNPIVAKQMAKNFKNRFQQYGFDPAIVDVTIADPEFGRTYQNLSDVMSGKLLGDREQLAKAVQSFGDAGLTTEGIAAMKDALDNARSDKQLSQQNEQFYAGLKNQKDIAEMGIRKTEARLDKDIAKEQRKEAKQLTEDLYNTDELLRTLSTVEERFKKYSKDSIGGTGPLVTMGGTTGIASAKTDALKADFSKISLEVLSKMFNGMSKLADTNSERARFEAAQPGVGKDDPVNEQILGDMIETAQRMREKILRARANLEAQTMSGSSESGPPPAAEPMSPEMRSIVQNALKVNPAADVQKIIEAANRKGIR